MSTFLIIANTNNDIKHNTSIRKTGIKYIVIHYTADSGATGANEVAYFNKKTTTRASADYFVDFDGTIYAYNNNPTVRYTWHCGGSKLNAHGIMHGIVRNNNSISIEMCCRKVNGIWTITNETYNGTVYAARVARYVFGIPSGRVYRHYDVTGKLCPNVKGFIGADESVWNRMRAAINSDSQDTSADIQGTQQAAKVTFKVNTNYKVTARRGVNVRVWHSTSSTIKRTYKYGTTFTCKEIYHGTDGRTWLRTPSGWMCGIDKDGSYYAG